MKNSTGPVFPAALWLKLGTLGLLLVGALWWLRGHGMSWSAWTPEALGEAIRSRGLWAPTIYALIYIQPIIPLPASLMIIAAGLAFGPVWGVTIAVVSSTVRACAQFLVARWLGREAIAHLLTGPVAAIDRRLGRGGFTTVLLIRIIPSFPFDVLNYGLGFSQVRFLPYAAGTLLGMIPISIAYVVLGHSLTDPRHLWKLLLAIGLIVGLVLLPKAWKPRPAAADDGEISGP